jgi:hypothetical protein
MHENMHTQKLLIRGKYSKQYILIKNKYVLIPFLYCHYIYPEFLDHTGAWYNFMLPFRCFRGKTSRYY